NDPVTQHAQTLAGVTYRTFCALHNEELGYIDGIGEFDLHRKYQPIHGYVDKSFQEETPDVISFDCIHD
ncbi:hypothetical protein M514_28380, partial [Trichuris suis]